MKADRAKKKPEPELIPAAPEPWTVRPVYKRRTAAEAKRGLPLVVRFWKLCYLGEYQGEKAAEGNEFAIRRLKELARLSNSMRHAPRKPIECVADASDSEAYRRKIFHTAPPRPEKLTAWDIAQKMAEWKTGQPMRP